MNRCETYIKKSVKELLNQDYIVDNITSLKDENIKITFTNGNLTSIVILKYKPKDGVFITKDMVNFADVRLTINFDNSLVPMCKSCKYQIKMSIAGVNAVELTNLSDHFKKLISVCTIPTIEYTDPVEELAKITSSICNSGDFRITKSEIIYY